METAITLSMLIMALMVSLVLALAVEKFLFDGFLYVIYARFDRAQPLASETTHPLWQGGTVLLGKQRTVLAGEPSRPLVFQP